MKICQDGYEISKMSKEEIQHHLKKSHQKILKIINNPNIKEINFFGSQTDKNQVINWLIQHEQFHIGKLVLYLSQAELNIPTSLKEMWGDRINARVGNHFLNNLVDMHGTPNKIVYQEKLNHLSLTDSSYLLQLGIDAIEFENTIKKITTHLLTSRKFEDGIIAMNPNWTSTNPFLNYNGKYKTYNNHRINYNRHHGESDTQRKENNIHKRALSALLQTEGFYDKWEKDEQSVLKLYRECELEKKDIAIKLCDDAESILYRLEQIYLAFEQIEGKKPH